VSVTYRAAVAFVGYRPGPATPATMLQPRRRIKNFPDLVAAAVSQHARG
jgi:hypothetical protein